MARDSLLSIDYASRHQGGRMVRRGAEIRGKRVFLLISAALVWVSIVVARLVSLQITDVERWREWALKQHFSEVTIASERGPILDRNSRMLAVSVPAGSVFVRPREVKDKKATATALARALNMKEGEIARKLDSSAPFVWIKRQMPRVFADKAVALNLPGVGQLAESRRFYPYNEAASVLIGRVGVDGSGLSGTESLFEQHLHGAAVKSRVTRDALGNQIELVAAGPEPLDLPKGKSLRLTLDAGIQAIMDQELETGRQDARARGAMALMADADTGEILGMSQSPSPNFNSEKIPSERSLRNLIVESVFEPGSIMKPIVAAAVIDAGLVSAREVLNCEGGRYRIGRHTIKDVHPYGSISFFDVLVRSSNIGMTKVGMRLGAERLYASLRAFGFGDSSSLGLPGETKGILRPVESWAAVDVATHSFGQGVAVTPLQMVRAVSAIANGGTLPTLHFIDNGRTREEQLGKRIISDRAAKIVREMMYGVVEDDHGTGKNALIAGVRVGGKTGTAQKARENGRGYAPGLYVASFIGFAEAEPLGVKRRLTLMVMIDEPHAGSIYGGTLAAPVFKRVMQRTLHYLSMSDEAEQSEGAAEDSIIAPGETSGVGLTQVSYRAP